MVILEGLVGEGAEDGELLCQLPTLPRGHRQEVAVAAQERL